MKSIWKGAISFGLVNIPVKLYTAVQESSLDLDMLDKNDLSNIHFKRVNEHTGREVPYENIVKGYLYHDEYVVLEPEDFEAADASKTHTIEIISFVDESEVDSIYFEQPYYLEPEKSGEKAYAILRDALASSGKAGLAAFVLRNKETLALVKPYQGAILLNRIRFEQEIRPLSGLKLPPAAKTKNKEQAMAVQLIKQLSGKFDISAYKDEYSEKLLKVIRQKAKGIKPKRPALKVVHTKADDLMSTLKASLSVNKRKAS